MERQQQQQPQRHRGDHGRSNRSLFRRTVCLMLVMGIGIFTPLIAQLVRLQIVEHDTWEQRAVSQQTKNVTLGANRGTIYDTQGRVMAISATVYRLILSPNAVLKSIDQDDYPDKEGKTYEQALAERRNLIVNWLAATFGYDRDRLVQRIEFTKSGYEILAYEMEEEQAELVRQFTSENHISNMLYLEPTSKRYYPYSSVGSHVLGFMNQNENSGDRKVGAQGVEAIYEDALSGEVGRVVISKNAQGVEMMSGYEMYFDAENGYDVTLSIDERIQAILENALAEGVETYNVTDGAFAIALDPNTGAVLGMASCPKFDPNDYADITDTFLQEQLQQIAAANGTDSDAYKEAVSAAFSLQLRNKALMDTYEPGSVFKPITVAIGLEEQILSMDDTYYCGGVKVVGGWPIHCHQHSGHGMQTLTKAVENSCNVALMDMAEKIGADTYWKYLEDFGFLDATGIDLSGEAKCILHSEEEFTGPYGAASLATYSFGQTIKVTPIRLITTWASLINGGHLLEPYVVSSIRDSAGNTVYSHGVKEIRQVISQSTSEKVQSIVQAVVNEGSGHNAYQAGYRIAGKTGTSEKKDEDTGDVVCSFMGYAPYDDPKVLVLMAFDAPERSASNSNYTPSGTYISGGNITAPVAGRVLKEILDYMGVERKFTESELASSDVSMRNVVGQELSVAMGTLRSANLNFRYIGAGNIVTDQIPSGGTRIPGGSTVILYLGDEKPTGLVPVPDLSGLSPDAAKSKLEEDGLFLRMSGTTGSGSKAVYQNIAVGTEVPMGTVVDVQFGDTIIDYDGDPSGAVPNP